MLIYEYLYDNIICKLSKWNINLNCIIFLDIEKNIYIEKKYILKDIFYKISI